jgi:hypothetical protein
MQLRPTERLAIAALALIAMAIVATALWQRPPAAGSRYATAIMAGSDEAAANAEADRANLEDLD